MFKTSPIESMTNALDVKGRNVVITEGDQGIGRGITEAFAQCGANVVLLCGDHENGLNIIDEITRHGGRYACFKCDIDDIKSVKAASKEVFGFFERVDVLINNADVNTKVPFLSEDGLKEWHRVIDTDLHGVANVIYEIAPSMRDKALGGSIINISSIAAQRVSGARTFHNAPYNVAKAGVEIFSKYLAVTLGDYGIRVNAIAAGAVHSSLDKNPPPKAAAETIEKNLPTHRFGEPIEVGALCVFLASPAGNRITGCVLPQDGGLLCIV